MRSKKVILIPLVVALIACPVNFNIGALAKQGTVDSTQSIDNSPVNYLTSRQDVKQSVKAYVEEKTLERKVNKLGSNNTINDDTKSLWIDASLSKDPKVKSKLKKLYNAGCKLIFRGDYITEKEILDYFSLKSDGLYFEDISTKNDLKRIGVFLQRRTDGSFDIVGLNSISQKETDIQDFMLYATNSKFMDRLRTKIDNKQSLISFNNVAYADWAPINYSASYDYQSLVNVNWSLSMSRDTANPVSGNYRSCSKSIVEAVPHSSPSNPGVQINNIHVWVDGGSSNGSWTSRNLDYTPMGNGSSDSGGSVSFTYPWGISFSYNLGGRTISYSTETGGIGYGYLQVLFHPSSPIKDTRGAGCVTTESYQNKSINSNPSYFKTNLKYFINDQNYIASPNTYYTETSSHSISGY